MSVTGVAGAEHRGHRGGHERPQLVRPAEVGGVAEEDAKRDGADVAAGSRVASRFMPLPTCLCFAVQPKLVGADWWW